MTVSKSYTAYSSKAARDGNEVVLRFDTAMSGEIEIIMRLEDFIRDFVAPIERRARAITLGGTEE